MWTGPARARGVAGVIAMTTRLALPAGCVALLASCAALLAGCGLGAGKAPADVQLTVTRNFGAGLLREAAAPRVVGQETVMSLLMRNFSVSTRYSGGFVESIDGLAGGREDGQPDDWFYYVNGVEAPEGAAETNVHPGDRIWWDRHDWSATDNIPAVVGSFPEPFLNGIGGERLQVHVECAPVSSDPCRTVTARLRSVGVPATVTRLGGGTGPHTLSVIVGPFSALSADPGVRAIEHGPAASGVYARMSASGGALTLLDERGRPVRTLSAGTGLVAATRFAEGEPLWVITGTDAAGVDLAADALDESDLHDHFAVALTASGVLPLPAASGSA